MVNHAQYIENVCKDLAHIIWWRCQTTSIYIQYEAHCILQSALCSLFGGAIGEDLGKTPCNCNNFLSLSAILCPESDCDTLKLSLESKYTNGTHRRILYRDVHQFRDGSCMRIRHQYCNYMHGGEMPRLIYHTAIPDTHNVQLLYWAYTSTWRAPRAREQCQTPH